MPLLKFEAFLVIVLDHHRQQKTNLSMLTNIIGILPLIHLCLIFSYLNHTYRSVFIQNINISHLLEMNWCRCIGKRFAFVFIHCCQIFEKQFSYNVFILFLRKIQNFSAKIVMDVKPTTRVHRQQKCFSSRDHVDMRNDY